MKHPSRQSGSAFWVILIAIALFASLSYIVMRDNRTQSSNLSDDQAKLAAQEIISYSNAVATAVQRMKLQGCLDTELMFYQAGGVYGASFLNASSPSDGSCNILSLNGGKVQAAIPSLQWDGGVTSTTNRYIVAANNNFPGTPSTDGDLFLMIMDIKLPICQKINEILKIEAANTTPKNMITDDSAVFNGTYSTPGYNVTATDYSGKDAFCVFDPSGGNADYRYIKILIAK